MAKKRTVFYCNNCGYESPKWLGQCPSCKQWNTFKEQAVIKTTPKNELVSSFSAGQKTNVPVGILDIKNTHESRYDLRNTELNRVLGGGLVKGSMVLIGGEPGIGKSTLLLQTALRLSPLNILYASGEESLNQIKLRADRLGIENESCSIFTETSIEKLSQQVLDVEPDILVVDSIQTLHTELVESSPGSLAQIRECTALLMKLAKQKNLPIILIGHITKDGQIAGPKILEHMVDCVLQFEGDRNNIYRILRSIKNRFGSTNELGIFEMASTGLKEVSNPSQILINQLSEDLSGIAIAATIEGLRPMLIETQALVSPATYGTPQRSSTGFDMRRLSMLLAVLEKKVGFKMSARDVFLNMAGGIRVDDPATDLAVLAAIISSQADIPINRKFCFAAEVGLSGEIRPVSKTDQRIKEAEKLGFEEIFISSYSFKKGNEPKTKLKLHQVTKIQEVYEKLFA